MKTVPGIRVGVDPSNPGQFFACCGLFELASRLWQGATARFSEAGDNFHIEGHHVGSPRHLFDAIASCSVRSSMGEERTARLKKLRATAKEKRSPEDLQEMDVLLSRLDEEKMWFDAPFDLAVDWWQDSFSGGQVFKTWAGLQLISELIEGIHKGIRSSDFGDLSAGKWFGTFSPLDNLPLYFDSDIGGQSSSIDVGFSLDSLRMSIRARPMIELAAFVGLQRFRPTLRNSDGAMCYSLWHIPLTPLLAATLTNGGAEFVRTSVFEFRLLYRTKYLKSFLPGQRKDNVHESA